MSDVLVLNDPDEYPSHGTGYTLSSTVIAFVAASVPILPAIITASFEGDTSNMATSEGAVCE
jgi:hypothetical protein